MKKSFSESKLKRERVSFVFVFFNKPHHYWCMGGNFFLILNSSWQTAFRYIAATRQKKMFKNNTSSLLLLFVYILLPINIKGWGILIIDKKIKVK